MSSFSAIRAQKDLDLWRTWKADPNQENLEPLLQALQPLINKRVSEFRGAPVPPAAIRGMANVAVWKAINGYNPKKGASLGTYATWHLKKVSAFVAKHQNVGRIPEHRVHKIREFKTVKADLAERLGRPPDGLQLADALGWTLAEVTRMENELVEDLQASRNLEPDLLPEIESSRDRQVLRYIYQDLTPDERLVFEYSLGYNGKPELKAGEIAKVMGISQPKVSRLRRKIDLKLQARGV